MLLLGQRPLTASEADHRLFADRSSELQRVRRGLDLGLNAYVHGPPGSGRTSFQRQVERDRPEARYVRLHGSETLADRIDEIERAVTGSNALQRPRPSPFAEVFKAVSTTEVKTAADPLRYLRRAVGPIGGGAVPRCACGRSRPEGLPRVVRAPARRTMGTADPMGGRRVGVITRSACRHLLRCCRRTAAV